VEVPGPALFLSEIDHILKYHRSPYFQMWAAAIGEYFPLASFIARLTSFPLKEDFLLSESRIGELTWPVASGNFEAAR